MFGLLIFGVETAKPNKFMWGPRLGSEVVRLGFDGKKLGSHVVRLPPLGSTTFLPRGLGRPWTRNLVNYVVRDEPGIQISKTS